MTLPPLPASVFSVVGPIPVVLVLDLTDSETGAAIFGCWDPFARVIKVRDGMTLTASWLTLVHEQTHADLAEIGVKLSENQAESVCNAIAQVRVAEMMTPR